MKVLITGGTGLLGKALIETALGHEILATYTGNYELNDQKIKYLKVDVLDKAANQKIFADFRPELVIHTASIGSPDFAAKNRELTWQVNVNGTANMIDLCETHGSKFIYISSNGIYDGEHAPYSEESPARPINYYGETKLAGEKLTAKAKLVTAIIRPILMYGWNHKFERDNIVTMAIAKLRKGEAMSVYDDVYSNPLFSLNCAQAIWQMVKSGQYGAFNVSGSETASIYTLIKKVAQAFGLDEAKIVPVKQGHFNELVKRPRDTSFDPKKMTAVLGIKPLALLEGLGEMKRIEP